MKNEFNITHVPYTAELKQWLLENKYHFFLIDEKELLTPFKNIQDLEYSLRELSNTENFKKCLITEYINSESASLNLSIETIHTLKDRAYLHYN